MSWFTTKRIGDVITLPTGVLIRVIEVRGTRVRLEMLTPAKDAPGPAREPKQSVDNDLNGGRR